MINSIPVNLLFLIVIYHWLADFVFQSDWMAKNKSSNYKALGVHISIYTLIFLAVFGWEYALVNGALHFCTDWVTSRITKKLWEKKSVHYFFVVIGLDQAIHLLCLIATAGLIKIWL